MSKTTETKDNCEEPSTSSQTKSEDIEMSNKCCANSGQSVSKAEDSCNARPTGVKHKLRSLGFGRHKNSLQCFANNKCKQSNQTNDKNLNKKQKKKKTSAVWVPFKMCARTDSCTDVTQPDNTYTPCVCTAYKKTEEQETNGSELTINVCNNASKNGERMDRLNTSPEAEFKPALNAMQANDSNDFMANDYSLTEPTVENSLVTYGVNGADNAYQSQSMMNEVRSVQVRVSEIALALRSQLALTVSPYPYLARWENGSEMGTTFLNRFCIRSDSSQALSEGQQIHTQIDYIHCLVPDLLQITNCSFYWGKMDRYEAERLLDNKPEGTFLLRDSAQEEHLFSVSFRRFDRSLHARIEQWNHRFSFDSHDPGVYSSDTVCGLIEHYKDPSHCMFFEPMLTIPLHRNFTFSLQHLSRAAITCRLTYDTIHSTQLPKRLKNYLKEYHYKQQVRVRRYDGDH